MGSSASVRSMVRLSGEHAPSVLEVGSRMPGLQPVCPGSFPVKRKRVCVQISTGVQRGLYCPCGLFLSMWFSLGLLACCFSGFSTFLKFSLSLVVCDYFGSSILGSVWITVCLSVSPLLCLSSLHRGLLAFAAFGLWRFFTCFFIFCWCFMVCLSHLLAIWPVTTKWGAPFLCFCFCRIVLV